MLKARQVMLLHIYAKAAALADDDYRGLLFRASGCRSSRDPRFDQPAFEAVMSALEAVLFDRVATGLVPDPMPLSRHILRRDYWRGRSRLHNNGRITPRQRHLIMDLWTQLAPQIGFPDIGSPEAVKYLIGIVRAGTGNPGRLAAISLSEHEAAILIDALRDRLSHLSPSAVSAPQRETLLKPERRLPCLQTATCN